MNLAELVNLQKEFDSHHKSAFSWDKKIGDENAEMLGFLLLSLFGEVGETANLTKKIIRGDFPLSQKQKELEAEIADIFIYTMKLSYQLDFDLERAFLDKLEENKKRFEKYESAPTQ